MRLISTRGQAKETSFQEALFQGLAPDGGLYHPVAIKDVRTILERLQPTATFNEVAEELAKLWLLDEWEATSLKKIVERAFNFSPQLKELDDQICLLELFTGPSLAFKDFGACFLAACMEEILASRNRKAIILVATSGDTGSAVARAFYGKKNIDVVILYPSGRVSFLQEKQLTTLSGNVHTFEVKGSFDDCQRMVKEAFVDAELKSSLTLTSANSINIGRLFPQAFYYVYGFLPFKAQAPDVVFCVPSGNFGNLTAGVYAWSWGLPVRQFIAATNINDVVPQYLTTAIYQPRPSLQTLSNAMDVGNPSNFERLLAVFNHKHRAMADLLWGEVVTDDETRKTISEVYHSHKVFLDPHTAVGYQAAKRYLAKHQAKPPKVIVLATAHPAKFSETIEEVTGTRPPLPKALAEALALPKRSQLIPNTLAALKEFLLQRFA